MTTKVAKQLKVTLVVSPSGKTTSFQRTLYGLGLKRPHQQVVVANTPSFRGAIKKVMHMVEVEEIHG
jgi:large subunit ribosomal protein L30